MNDLYYLRSILRNLREIAEQVDGPGLASEVIHDNIDWLDCYIERLERRKRNMTDDCFDLSDHEEDYRPHPEKSTILCQIIEGDSYLFQQWNKEKTCYENLGLEFHEFQYEGGSAEIENEAGVLEDVVANLLIPEYCRVGWFVIEGFYAHYSKDYYGDCDADHECDNIREARWSDIEYMGLMKAPWYIKALRWFGIDPEVPPRLMYPAIEPIPQKPTPAPIMVAPTRPLHHPKCPRCKGQGFYLTHHGRGYYHDGSFGHNQWEDCRCYPEMDEDDLPKAFEPTGDSW